MDLVNWMLILTGEVILVLEAECLKTFQVRFVVRSSGSVGLCFFAFGKSRGFFTSAFVDFLFLVANLNVHLSDIMIPHLRTLGFLFLELEPKAGSNWLQLEVHVDQG